jgi:pimeloyl-ACP methyl ester carboxylesterase
MTTSLWTELLGAEVRYVDAGGVRTRALQAGRGPAVIFLHGTGSTAEAFARNVIPFSERFSAHSIDLLGHGLTDLPGPLTRETFVKHIIDYMDTMGIERASVVGNSLGGWLAIWTALSFPDRVEKVVNAVGPHFAVPLPEEARQKAQAQTERLRLLSKQLADNPSPETMRARLGWVFHDVERNLTEDLVEVRWAMHQLANHSQAVSAIVGNPGAENLLTNERLAAVTRPTMVLWTDHNPAPVAVAEAVVRHLPHGRLAVMKDCGHWPQWEDPATFNRVVMEFLSG